MDNGNWVYVTLTRIERLNKYNEIVESMNGNYGIIYLDSGNYIELKDNTEVIDANDIDNNATDTTTTVTDNNVEENNKFSSDDYNIISQIGEGTFGKIYQVEGLNKKKYAMKKILANSIK